MNNSVMNNSVMNNTVIKKTIINKKELTLLRSQSFINGEWLNADDNSTFPVTNPANGEVISQVSALGAKETQRAIEAAEKALAGWQALTAKTRSNYLRQWFNLIIQHEDQLATLLSLEQGKPLKEALGEIRYGASFIEWFAEEAKRSYGQVIPSPIAGRRMMVIKQPIGVVGAITPWNFPNAMITRKVAPALAAGCTVVLKPAAETPLSALALVALAQQAGIPAGVLNVVTGNCATAIGAVITASPIVRKLSFTGSTKIGKLLYSQCADTVKKLSLELGGNAPFIVFDDADIDAAVQGAMIAKYRNAGQTCVCVNRFLVQDTVYDQFAHKLAAAVSQLTVGPALDGDYQQGPLINQASVNKVSEHIHDACAKGAKILAGGKPHALGGLFFQPTVLSQVTTNMLIADEETFGPVAALIRFKDEQEAINIANKSDTGLAAYFYSQNISRIYRMAEAVECGMIGINEGLISNESAPFGGIKQSGLGREGSSYGMDEFMEIKYLCFGNLNLAESF